MKRLKKLKILKDLHFLKSIGVEYVESLGTSIDTKKSNALLPNDISHIKKLVQNCHLCQLSKTRKNVVFGEGNLKADIFFIGEGPGANEDETGKPFVGRAGEILTKMIENVLFVKRSDVYISNIVKCRPPGNRAPTEEEVESCLPYLLKQIEIVNPKIIVTLGSTAYKNLTGDTTPISRIRGEVLEYKNAKLIPTFHPSFLLRNPSAKKLVFLDMKKIKSLMPT